MDKEYNKSRFERKNSYKRKQQNKRLERERQREAGYRGRFES